MSEQTLPKLIQVHQEAALLLKRYGLTEKGWTFEISNQKRRVGECNHRRKVIRYSQHFMDKTPSESITDTLLHEIAHALVGPGYGHGNHWKYAAKLIGANPERMCNDAVSTAKPNYILHCGHCKIKWERYRLRLKPGQYSCPHCARTLAVFKTGS